MKAKYVLICMAVLTILPAVVCSCGVDRWAAYAERTKTDRWIDDTMRTWYYWYRDMPDENHVNYFVPPFEFFESVLSPKDGKGGYAYSTIDSLETGTRSIPYTDYSYGFQFTTNRVESNDTALYAHILYVAKGSPADEAGLQRGDWIMEMDGEVITQDNYAALLGSRSMQLTVGYYHSLRGAYAHSPGKGRERQSRAPSVRLRHGKRQADRLLGVQPLHSGHD